MVTVDYIDIGRCTYNYDDSTQDQSFGWSQNPIRDAVCEELHRRRRIFNIERGNIPTLYDFLTESNSCRIYIPVLETTIPWNWVQVWEGVTLSELIEHHEDLLPRALKHYQCLHCYDWTVGFDVSDLLDKFSRMKSPVQMAAFSLRKLSTLKRIPKWNQ